MDVETLLGLDIQEDQDKWREKLQSQATAAMPLDTWGDAVRRVPL